MMTKGIMINNKHTYEDFNLYIDSKTIGVPTKQNNFESIPYMNGFYDFSTLNGSQVYDKRQIEYTFDLIADSQNEIEEQKSNILMWLYGVNDVDIYDDDITDYHFHGSISNIDWSEDYLCGTLTITFDCYPFKIANGKVDIELEEGENTIEYDGLSCILSGCVESGTATITIGTKTLTIGENETNIGVISENITITNTNNVEGIHLYYRKEVL